jgi:hypothetical protein
MMKGPLLTIIAPLEQPYPEFYSVFKTIIDQKEEDLPLDDTAEKIRVKLAEALQTEQPNSPKALIVYEAVKNLLKLYPKNRKDEVSGQYFCPISLEEIDLQNIQENFYSSASGYIYKREKGIYTWFETNHNTNADPTNRQDLSPHEMNLLYPNRAQVIANLQQDELYRFEQLSAREQVVVIQHRLNFAREHDELRTNGFGIVCLASFIVSSKVDNHDGAFIATFAIGLLLLAGILYAHSSRYSSQVRVLLRTRGAPENRDQERDVEFNLIVPPRQ